MIDRGQLAGAYWGLNALTTGYAQHEEIQSFVIHA